MEIKMSSKLIVALDFSSADQALEFVNPLSPPDCKLKVGFELFVSAGPDLVRTLTGKGFDIFLDLKFHDIPNTVASVCKEAAKLDVWMMNVHASGGLEMMYAAHAALSELACPPKLIAVSVLTSMNDEQLQETGVDRLAKDQVFHLAGLAKQAGLDGMVCSAQEAKALRQQFGDEFLLVTPGIRPVGAERGDQSRVMTPRDAIQEGVDYIVVGRPITQSSTPLEIIRQINADLVHQPV
ncbi:PREDICTED: orotidine 5'-phosphate decarboxylase-like [Priapulus caudatus]|uniref:Orotidine 5'-phosphate decarboxylase n=1 Tax=Priapulus caudatus TaxID=37621 RepID=A0ABM1F705_PRICU|nr:PREDICTED: orotidine 5'-phosphate decarboxylase-like [Priapulus caudatus]